MKKDDKDKTSIKTEGDHSPILISKGKIESKVIQTNIENYHVNYTRNDHYEKLVRTQDELISSLKNSLQSKDAEVTETKNKLSSVENKLEENDKGYKEKIDLLQNSLRELEQLNEELPSSKFKMIKNELSNGNFINAKNHLTEIRNQSSEVIAYSFFLEANIAQEQFDHFETKKYLEEAIKHQPNNTLYLNNLGVISALEPIRDYKNAEKYLSEALRLDKDQYGEMHVNVIRDLNNLAFVFMLYKEWDLSLKHFKNAIDLEEALYGEKVYETAIKLNNIGEIYRHNENPIEAIKYYEEAKSLIKSEDEFLAVLYNNLGSALRMCGFRDPALQHYQKALEIDTEIFVENHPSIARDLNNIGVALFDSKKFDDAIEKHEQASTINLDKFGKINSFLATDYNNLGNAWNGKNNKLKAIFYYEKALKIYKIILGKDHDKTKFVEDKIKKTKRSRPYYS